MSAIFFVTSKHDRSQYHLADATGRPRCGARFRHATQLVTKYEPRSLCSNCWQYSYRALVLSGEAWFPNCFIFEADGRWHIEGNSINHPICLPLISLAPERRHYHRLVPLSERESIAKSACEACLQAGRETFLSLAFEIDRWESLSRIRIHYESPKVQQLLFEISPP